MTLSSERPFSERPSDLVKVLESLLEVNKQKSIEDIYQRALYYASGEYEANSSESQQDENYLLAVAQLVLSVTANVSGDDTVQTIPIEEVAGRITNNPATQNLMNEAFEKMLANAPNFSFMIKPLRRVLEMITSNINPQKTAAASSRQLFMSGQQIDPLYYEGAFEIIQRGLLSYYLQKSLFDTLLQRRGPTDPANINYQQSLALPLEVAKQNTKCFIYCDGFVFFPAEQGGVINLINVRYPTILKFEVVAEGVDLAKPTNLKGLNRSLFNSFRSRKNFRDKYAFVRIEERDEEPHLIIDLQEGREVFAIYNGTDYFLNPNHPYQIQD
ncbi:MAG: hypothetical protein OHK0017_05520 [Patescibacteria group bacterium]